MAGDSEVESLLGRDGPRRTTGHATGKVVRGAELAAGRLASLRSTAARFESILVNVSHPPRTELGASTARADSLGDE